MRSSGGEILSFAFPPRIQNILNPKLVQTRNIVGNQNDIRGHDFGAPIVVLMPFKIDFKGLLILVESARPEIAVLLLDKRPGKLTTRLEPELIHDIIPGVDPLADKRIGSQGGFGLLRKGVPQPNKKSAVTKNPNPCQI